MSFLSLIQNTPRPHWRDAIDILLVFYITYRVVRLIRGTRAWTVLMGILAFCSVLWLSHLLRLRALAFLLDQAARIGPVALLVVFLPEVRQWVMEMGTGTFWRGTLFGASTDVLKMIDEVIQAVEALACSRTGALIAIEGKVGLADIATTGRRLDSLISSELIQTIFFPGSALHDGAILIRDGRVIAAGCQLPMPAISSRSLTRTAHTRHASALELAQQSDALVVVVSEETGSISLASSRSLIKGLTGQQLRERLVERLRAEEHPHRFQLFKR